MSAPLLARPAGADPATAFMADGVVVHRVRLAATTGRARAAEARALAAELAATPADQLHLALGPVAPDGEAWLAIADPAAVEAALAAAAPPPARLVPAALLLPPPPPGSASAARLGDLLLLRTAETAATLDPALARAILPEAAAPPAPDFDSLPLDDPGLDLLVGRFAPRRPFWQAKGFRPATLVLAALALLLALVPPVAERLRSAAAARLADEATIAIAARVAGQPFADAEAAAAAVARLARERGSAEVTPRLAALMAALEPVAGARLEALAWAPATGLAATLAGDAAAINAVAARLATAPFATSQEGDTLRLAAPRPPASAGASPAEARLATVRATAERLAGRQPRAAGPAAPQLAALLAGAGLPDPAVGTTGSGTARVTLPAIRAAVLLPLLARIEAAGLGIQSLSIRAAPGPAPACAAELEVR